MTYLVSFSSPPPEKAQCGVNLWTRPRAYWPLAWIVFVSGHGRQPDRYVACRGTGYTIPGSYNLCGGCCAESIAHAFLVEDHEHTCGAST